MGTVTILCYHAVEDGWESPLAVPPRQFEVQCSWLARHRRVVELDEAVRHLRPDGSLPRGWVALTFDDGFASTYEHAFGILRRWGLPATVFLVAETLTSTGRPVDWVDTPPTRPLQTLTREQILEMQQEGVSFGSHSYAHHVLTTLDPQTCVGDLQRSRELLEELLGRPVPYLAYPRGIHDAGVRTAAADAGYTHAFALPESPEPVGPYAIPRVGVYPGNSVPVLAAKTRESYRRLRTSRAYPLVRRLSGKGPPPTRRTG